MTAEDGRHDGARGPDPSSLVFNVVWTGRVFTHLAPFTASVLHHEPVRVRFVANACPRDEVDAMHRFAERHPGRVVDVVVASDDRMIRHGDCLDLVLRTTDDGDHVGLLDPDILATGPWLGPLLSPLAAGAVAVTSGREVWSETNVRPPDHIGVNGEYFFDADGFAFGSPHLAVYRADALRETMARWGVGFASAGNDIPEATRARLDAAGRGYWIYDTGKIVNILLQLDGGRLEHDEVDTLVHIGGLPHFLAPPSSVEGVEHGWAERADWSDLPGMAPRFAVAGFTAATLQALDLGEAPPTVPPDVPAPLAARMRTAGDAVVRLVQDFGTGPEGLPVAAT